jgi:hypothetical protein
VQHWLDNPAENFGWFFIGDEVGFGTAKKFHSRHAKEPQLRPRLMVTYTEPPAGCYANCDSSTTIPFLNVNDFVCFQQQFAAGASFANCDGSTTAPVLNVNDFVCFQQQFAAGCSAP